jgi:hypothetical protein
MSVTRAMRFQRMRCSTPILRSCHIATPEMPSTVRRRERSGHRPRWQGPGRRPVAERRCSPTPAARHLLQSR